MAKTMVVNGCLVVCSVYAMHTSVRPTAHIHTVVLE